MEHCYPSTDEVPPDFTISTVTYIGIALTSRASTLASSVRETLSRTRRLPRAPRMSLRTLRPARNRIRQLISPNRLYRRRASSKSTNATENI